MKEEIEKGTPSEMPTDIIPQRQALVKQTADVDGFLEKRQEFIQKVSAICVEGKDYHIIQGKKSLAKGGAEKIASIFQWNATFIKDTESLEMLGQIVGLVAFKCTLAKGNKFVGEGRGAATLAKNSGDPNKTLKMAQKSAFIDAVLRASGLSDFFTQDLEDMNVNDIGRPQDMVVRNQDGEPVWIKGAGSDKPFAPSEKQIDTIKKNMEEKNISEADLMDEGFPPLKDLTGGKDGTASEVIGYLFKISKYSNGLRPLTEEDRMVSQFIKDLEDCTTVAMYQKVADEIKLAKDMGHLVDGYNIVLKAAKVNVQRIQDSLNNPVIETKPMSKAAELMQRGINKTK